MMKQIALINLENISEQEAAGYKTRGAARAVVFDEAGLIALLHATKYDYFKLPGGGIEKDEDPVTAMKRECREEIGCDVEVTGELGMIVEYRKKFGLKQTSYCYIAKLVGKKGTPQLMEDEIEEGFQTVWLPLEDALNRVKESQRDVYEAQYMVARDTAFLEAALNHK
jgi:8-oxo-dGTP pyrophosphatase MutT (NUDIX family)